MNPFQVLGQSRFEAKSFTTFLTLKVKKDYKIKNDFVKIAYSLFKYFMQASKSY